MRRVFVNGASGKMGQAVVAAVAQAEGVTQDGEASLGQDFKTELANSNADVVVDFTHPSCIKENIDIMIEAGVHGVIGTTGLSEADLADIDRKAQKKGVSIYICPNFAIGALIIALSISGPLVISIACFRSTPFLRLNAFLIANPNLVVTP